MEKPAEKMTRITADRTHLFPGARLETTAAPGSEPLETVILFSDGARAEGTLLATPAGASLHVEPYRTGAGTRIPAKTWTLVLAGEGMLRVSGPSRR
ncbi:hypothetical protein [Brachybacterium hainanense]|uniref:Uncharacterized protein n=1 Tax=Brachybacterium hainanense TaxID=1541174 RepID=A0ABV6REG2_9MICO